MNCGKPKVCKTMVIAAKPRHGGEGSETIPSWSTSSDKFDAGSALHPRESGDDDIVHPLWKHEDKCNGRLLVPSPVGGAILASISL